MKSNPPFVVSVTTNNQTPSFIKVTDNNKKTKTKDYLKMEFDPANNVIKLCAEGMQMEGKGKPEEASKLFFQAWHEAINNLEKFKAAHYVARHQKNVADKLKWDETALQLAQNINNETVQEFFPSLYLNIAKCYENLNDIENAKKNYDKALSYTDFLPDNGYGNIIKGGIIKGLERISK
jgi:tetratricopeptide (TPR) repeat protein